VRWLLLLAACADAAEMPPDMGASRDVFERDAEMEKDAGLEEDAGVACVLGRSCNPILIAAFPFTDRRDTSLSDSDEVDRYACAQDTDEAGPEYWYRMSLPTAGTLRIRVDDVPGDAVDVDVHLLQSIDPASCLHRNNLALSVQVAAGEYFLTADTWVNASGAELAGPYLLTVDFTATATGSCAMVDRDLRMFWTACDPSVPDCFEAPGPDGNLARFLKTPTTGPVVKEAHLVTTEEDFGGGWPSSFTDMIDRHYQISELEVGIPFDRTEPWAPAGEGGSEFGQGATGAPLPVLDEAWYINMYWRERPAPGTRMLVRNPESGLTVVASAGYETGPGSNTAIGGVVEEIHLYLGTQHRDRLQIGFAADQSLPLGPIDCP
jgi:hypothetical protein